jgi:hypothetical protein
MKLNQERTAIGGTVAVILLIIGLAASSGVCVVLGAFLLLVVIAAIASANKSTKLTAAGHGATRIETVHKRSVNQTVKQYTAAGWEVVGQSSAKSIGSQPQVTITFRKP